MIKRYVADNAGRRQTDVFEDGLTTMVLPLVLGHDEHRRLLDDCKIG